AYGYALEMVAIHLFGSHTYGTAWLLAPRGVPIAVALVWAAVISSAMALAARTGWHGSGTRAAAAALVAISLDLLMEPVAVRSGLWRW
ncbi:carotenoid biosynthesis protein, partial [Klebsiella pneumoniae]|uniref:carotenoid biosynthesis protein n=1 Tax=Klebsiella pneumoniae TaxID=573 RepID=UPI00226E160D